jgi:hypothetical protein
VHRLAIAASVERARLVVVGLVVFVELRLLAALIAEHAPAVAVDLLGSEAEGDLFVFAIPGVAA